MKDVRVIRGSSSGRRIVSLVVAVGLVALGSSEARAELAAEPLNQNTTLPAPGAHAVWLMDFSTEDLASTRHIRVDGDDGAVAGMLRTGSFPTLDRSEDGRWLYVAETWLEGPRRLRHDYVTIYDATTLRVDAVIPLPGRRRALMSPRHRTALTADGSLLLVFNFTPGTSLTVVDPAKREIVGEVPTPGCSLVYPTGERGVSMICGDGSLLTVHFEADGSVRAKHRSEVFFDPDVDPVIENAAPMNGRWLFTTYGGALHDVDLSGEKPVFSEPWPLVDPDKKKANIFATIFTGGKAGPWKPGGYQLMTSHEASGRLFVLTHPVTWSGGKGDHVFPGAEVWVYDVAARERIDRIDLNGVGLSIHVTQDEAPLLVVGSADIETEKPGVEFYDADSGRYLRSLSEPGSGAKLYIYGATTP